MLVIVLSAMMSLLNRNRYPTAEALAARLAREGSSVVNKTIIVSGGNTGVGYETARVLALNGARVVLGCRNREKGLAAVDRINSAISQRSTGIAEFIQLDLASFASIHRFASAFNDGGDEIPRPLHVLILNAGIISTTFSSTADGLEVLLIYFFLV